MAITCVSMCTFSWTQSHSTLCVPPEIVGCICAPSTAFPSVPRPAAVNETGTHLSAGFIHLAFSIVRCMSPRSTGKLVHFTMDLCSTQRKLLNTFLACLCEGSSQILRRPWLQFTLCGPPEIVGGLCSPGTAFPSVPLPAAVDETGAHLSAGFIHLALGIVRRVCSNSTGKLVHFTVDLCSTQRTLLITFVATLCEDSSQRWLPFFGGIMVLWNFRFGLCPILFHVLLQFLGFCIVCILVFQQRPDRN